MTSGKRAATKSQSLSFLNRDHIVLVTINSSQIEITTTAGTRLFVAASPSALAKFVDELINAEGSNFVSDVSLAEE
jgi:hypothetical protein